MNFCTIKSVLGRAVRHFRVVLALGWGMLIVCDVHAQTTCTFDEVGKQYGIAPELLVAIAKTESNLNPRAMNTNANGSVDIGLMQINSSWLPVLKKYGIDQNTLLSNSCINMQIGAWILRKNIDKLGYGWNAVGAYNAARPDRRMQYALRVSHNLSSGSGSTSMTAASLRPTRRSLRMTNMMIDEDDTQN